ncbi:hypothetical protein MYX75_01105 [Acidobacteria bacterium AH-259-A15]|nr:hypothetical protein [Acidobacteria bacterium AH-259-A15]
MQKLKKNWWKSKTLWTALGSLVTVVAAEILADPEVALQIEKTTAAILPLLMIILRVVTKGPVGLKGE